MESDPSEPRRNISLAARATAALGGMRPGAWRLTWRPTSPARAGWRAGVAVAALIAAGPLLTIGGAAWLAAGARADAARLEARAAPRRAAERADAQARTVLRRLARQPALGATLDALARALPDDAGVAHAARRSDGGLDIAIAAPDPDQVRAALAQAPELAGLRNIGQQRTDAGMLVTFAGDAR